MEQHGNLPPAPASAIGGLANLGADEVLLPGYIERRPDGLYVGAAAARFDNGFRVFVERVFGAGAYFVDLDYAVFQDLLFGEQDTEAGLLRLAADIRHFSPGRRALYRAVRLGPGARVAEYMFEPVELEVEKSVPVFGPADADGTLPVIGMQVVKSGVPTRLDADEFVAAMWEKGVRFGIDIDVVRAAIANDQRQRLEIARMRPPSAGRDAGIEEKTTALHRDNAPVILPDGRMDLRHFKNRFPQVKAGVRLLQKLPRQLGDAGHDIAGKRLDPLLPRDFDLALQAGPGTLVERGADGEFIVSARDGFIHIDRQSNQLSVRDKIVSREGISMRTTGDVSLAGDEFEEHGEVQERRVVEGRNMTFHADVFGSIVSRGGQVVLKENLAGGSVVSAGGSVRVEGRASRSVLEARGGEVFAEFAEGCSIVGSRVTVNHAVNCDILGEDVVIGVSEGCAIGGKRVNIAQSRARKEIETIVAVLVPDTSRIVRETREREKARQPVMRKLIEVDAAIGRMLADARFKQYLALASTIASKEARLTDAQEESWRHAQVTFAGQIREWQAAQQARAEVHAKLDALDAELAELGERSRAATAGIACAIAEIGGDTLVRRMAFQPESSPVGETQGKEIAAHLREFGTSVDRLYWGGSGRFDWRIERDGDASGAA